MLLRANSMAQGRGNAIAFTLVVLALLQVAAAKTYTVGGITGSWTWHPSDPNFYTEWASKQSFVPGDKLLFMYGYDYAMHNVQVSTLAEYIGCLYGYSEGTHFESGSHIVELPTAGDYYFISNFLTDCESGMKMKVTVRPAAPSATIRLWQFPAPQATPPPAIAPVVASVAPPRPLSRREGPCSRAYHYHTWQADLAFLLESLLSGNTALVVLSKFFSWWTNVLAGGQILWQECQNCLQYMVCYTIFHYFKGRFTLLDGCNFQSLKFLSPSLFKIIDLVLHFVLIGSSNFGGTSEVNCVYYDQIH